MKLEKLSKLTGPFFVWICTVVIWGLYRKFFILNEVIEELILKPVVFLGPVFLYLHRLKSVTAKSLGLVISSKKSIVIWGGVFGFFLMLEGLFVMTIKGKALQADQLVFVVILTNLIVSIATAISEEILYRGFLLQKIEEVLHIEQLANFVTALLFTVAHMGIAWFVFEYRGITLTTYLLTILVSGYAYGFIFQKTRSVYASIIAHLLWNFSNTFFM